MKRSTLSLILVLSLVFVTYSHVVRADCTVNGAPEMDGTAADDTITCSGPSTGPLDDGVGGRSGDDTITVEAGTTVSYVGGDARGMPASISTIDASVEGAPGSDTIVIAGTADGVWGDYSAYVDDADDSITVTSTGHVENSISGDSGGIPEYLIGIKEGDDTINIEAGGVVDSNVNGDSDFLQGEFVGGNDSITVNGTVGGNVNGQIGNDTITIGGTVGGTVDGGSGNDNITLNDGANGGADSTLTVNGGDGNDSLTFAYTISSQGDYNALASLIAANAPSGSITINGQTITWSNFEQLVNALIANFSVGTKVAFKDNRLNSTDAGASALTYCTGSGIQVLGINPTTAQGSEAFTVTTAQIQAALAEAKSTASNVAITTAAGITLFATPDGQLIVTAPDIGDASKTYQFSFDASVCGIS